MKTKRLFLQLAMLVSLLVVLYCIGHFVYNHCDGIYGTIIVGLLIIIAGWLFLAALHSLTKQSWLIILLFLLLCGWGIVIYQPTECNKYEPVAKIIAPLNNTLSIFFPSRGGFDDHDNYERYTSYQMLHLCAFFFSALFVFSIFGRRLINSSRRFLNISANKNIFWGDSSGGKLLAQDILDTRLLQQTIFVFPHDVRDDEEKEKALFEKIDSMGGIVLYRDLDNLKRYPKGHRHFFLTEDQNFNMEMSARLLCQLKSKTPTKDVNIYVRTESDQFYSFIENELKQNCKKCEKIVFHIFNQSDLTARLFVKENPMLESENIEIDRESLHVKGDFNVLFLGFGWQGQELLKKCVCDSQFVGIKFQATVIDRDLEKCNGDYPVLYDECIEEYNLQFVTETVGSAAFYKWIDAHILEFNRIIISLGNDNINMDAAEKIVKILHKQGVVETQKTQKRVFARMQQVIPYTNDFTAFGNLKNMYIEEMIVHGEMDMIAKHLNFMWSNGKYPTPEKAWSGEGTNLMWNQDSSRASALGISNALHLLGMKYVKESERKKDDRVVTAKEFHDAINLAIEILAENEHKRWNAYHFTKGVRLWKMNDIDYDTLKKTDMKANQVNEYNRHAALVDFNQLPDLDKIINTERDRWNTENPDKIKGQDNNQQKDRNSILAIYQSLMEAKYSIIYKKQTK